MECKITFNHEMVDLWFNLMAMSENGGDCFDVNYCFDYEGGAT